MRATDSIAAEGIATRAMLDVVDTGSGSTRWTFAPAIAETGALSAGADAVEDFEADAVALAAEAAEEILEAAAEAKEEAEALEDEDGLTTSCQQPVDRPAQ